MKEKYPAYKHKVFTARLGTKEHGTNHFKTNDVFTIVSCATIRNIKRIHLIADILWHIDSPIKWIHIGSESQNDPTLPVLRTKLAELKQSKANVEVKFMGGLRNEDVLKFYLNNPVHLFVSVSETEGLPVSIMEAISFGIPVMATDVGGCNEIVTERTGFLIAKDLDPKNVADRIVEFTSSTKNSEAFRQGCKNFGRRSLK